MQLFWTILLGGIAVFWIAYGVYCLVQVRRIPRLEDFPPRPADSGALVSVLVAARDEAKRLPAALPTLLSQTYPRYEVVFADDRSQDGTGALLDEFARRDPRLRALHIRELPPGWLGKTHALAAAYGECRGEWLLFTDADVRMDPEAVARAMHLAQSRNLDHLTLVASLDMRGFWEPVAISYISLAFLLGIRPWRVGKAGAGSYMGIGAFQLVRRTAYDAVGGHRRLAMEVVDDMKLGKLIKRGGYRSAVGIANRYVVVRWQEGLGNIIRGLTKNMFAGMSFHSWKALATIFGVLLLSVLPFVALGFAHGAALVCAAAGSAGAIGFNAAVLAGSGGASPAYAAAHPLGALVFVWIAARSAIVTLWRGGIIWRDTFYPLEELRRGMV
ncbi:MAG TPA: glycosyltransferase family 2 protein [Candidatus Acidoferrales bacterium]|nr:glycosyltransferase family 2 protein [Candidatus Acidoferrales bacterium]